MMLHPINRRAFLASASLAALPLMAVQKEVRVGIIGAGSRGTTLLENTLHQKNVRVTAICDIDEGHATRAQNMVEKATGQRPAPYTLGPEDYKRLLERQDVDAVLIMTTQDQHARQAINAMKAGKHVGCETPPPPIVLSNVGSWCKPRRKLGSATCF